MEQRYADRRDEAGRDFAAYVRDHIAAAMLAKGRSARQVAIGTGISETTMRRRLEAVLPFNAREVDQIAGYLDMSIAELLNADGFVIVGDVTIEGDGDNVINIGSGSVG